MVESVAAATLRSFGPSGRTSWLLAGQLAQCERLRCRVCRIVSYGYARAHRAEPVLSDLIMVAVWLMLSTAGAANRAREGSCPTLPRRCRVPALRATLARWHSDRSPTYRTARSSRQRQAQRRQAAKRRNAATPRRRAPARSSQRGNGRHDDARQDDDRTTTGRRQDGQCGNGRQYVTR